MSTAEYSGSYIRVNRLKDSWTWNVQVATTSNTPEGLQEAKLAALQVAYELREELQPVKELAPKEVPF
jgi:hypothetical protein